MNNYMQTYFRRSWEDTNLVQSEVESAKVLPFTIVKITVPEKKKASLDKFTKIVKNEDV